MSDPNLSEELERRLQLLEDPDSHESPLDDLPWQDVALVVAGIVIMSVLLLIWAYPR